MLPVCSPVAGVEVMKDPSRRWSRRIIRPMHRRAARRAAQLIRLALLEKCVVFITIATGRRSQTSSPGAEIIFLLEVMGRVRRERGFALRSKGWVGDSVGESASSAEVHDVAEGHPGRYREKEARDIVSRDRVEQDNWRRTR